VSETTCIAALQMVSGPEIADNLRQAAQLVAAAAARGARLVALPEYFPLMSANETDKLRARESEGAGPLQDFLRETAVKNKVWLVGGSIPLRASAADKVRNSCLVFDDTGRRVARYDKIHLFGFQRGTEKYDESQTIEAGTEPVVFDSPCGRVGLSICYDLRFPELYRAMGAVDLLVVPAAFTHTTGQAHWELLLRARAVENLCYVLASAQGGTHPSGRQTWGDSMIVDPWGEVLDRLAKGAGIVVAEMDRLRLAEVRASLPALRHRVLK
jgi:nitrilase